MNDALFDCQRCGMKAECAKNAARVIDLLDALRRISLGSQNSMTTMRDLGQEARAAIAKATEAK